MPLSPSHRPKLRFSLFDESGADADEHRGRWKHRLRIDVATAAHLQGRVHGALDDGDKPALRALGGELHYYDG